MTAYVQFYGKRTWHIVSPEYEAAPMVFVPTVCGEPSIATAPGKGPMIMRGAVPNRVCERCEKRNR